MKRFSIFSLLIGALLILSACQTQTLVEDIGTIPTGEQNVKAPVRQMPIDPTAYISESGLTTQTEGPNLLNNSGFELGSLDGWTACENDGIRASNDAYEGSGALEVVPGNCFYQSVTEILDHGDELTLSCYAKILSGNGWTGMGIGFADSSWNTIGDGASTVITGNSYERYDLLTTAPRNVKYISMWFYSDNPVVVDSCALRTAGGPPPLPTLPSGDNLLDFRGLDNWSIGCSGSAVEANDGLLIRNGACLDQSLSASDIAALQGKDYTYSCIVQNTGGYASMSVFLDGQPSSVVLPNDYSYETVELKGTAGSNINSGFVSIYAEGELHVLSCTLFADGSDSPVEPKITIRNLGSDTITSGNPVEVTLGIQNSGNVTFDILNVSSEGNILPCGFNLPDIGVGIVRTYTCTTPSVALGETKTYTIVAKATIDDNGTPLTIKETYTITQSNVVQTLNLIENGNFEGSFTDTWTVGCGGTYSSPPGRSGQGTQPLSGACIDQALSIGDLTTLAGNQYSYSCYAKNTGSYGALSIFFDGQVTSEVIPVSNEFQLIEVRGVAPSASSGFVSIYGEDNNIVLDDCRLEVVGAGPEPTGTPSIDVRNSIEGDDRFLSTGPFTFDVAVRNNGDVPLTDVILESDELDCTATFAMLAVDEIKTISCYSPTALSSFESFNHVVTATASTADGRTVSDTDSSAYSFPRRGSNNLLLNIVTDDAVVPAGSDVTFFVNVANGGTPGRLQIVEIQSNVANCVRQFSPAITSGEVEVYQCVATNVQESFIATVNVPSVGNNTAYGSNQISITIEY